MKRGKLRKQSKTKVSTLKRKLWKVFADYIKLRDKYTCFTCGRKGEGSGIHAGHFINKSIGGISLYFHEENVRAQCLTKDSKILTKKLGYLPINKINIGDKIKAFDEKTFKKIDGVVTNINSFIPEKLYKVEMEDGSVFFCTGDHKVVANNKWMTVEDMLHSCVAHDILEI